MQQVVISLGEQLVKQEIEVTESGFKVTFQ